MKLLLYCFLATGTFAAASQTVVPAKAPHVVTFRTLHTFSGKYDSGYPAGGLILDAHGNLYGTNEGAGQTPDGIAFELARPVSGADWPLTPLFSFGPPYGFGAGSNLAFDGNGNLYGTTASGGARCTFGTCGTVFELSPDGSGGWQGRTIYEFQGGNDGSGPIAGLVLDANGNLYGTTTFGGGSCAFSISGCGIVFELTPANGLWTESILHHFAGTDGLLPQAGLVFDTQGNLYGTTSNGGSGSCSCGTVFELSPATGGTWMWKGLHEFSGNDGAYPSSTLVFDKAGNLYGTTLEGGRSNDGLVFRLVPSPNGGWKEQLLHSFQGLDGQAVWVGVVLDASGNVYGTAQGGGSAGDGVAYALRPTTGGAWTFSLLHTFTGADGVGPTQLVLDSYGRLFGITNSGGAHNFGTVFTIKP
jgi:uncharacterized repeat protein (TIGR03803 family)